MYLTNLWHLLSEHRQSSYLINIPPTIRCNSDRKRVELRVSGQHLSRVAVIYTDVQPDATRVSRPNSLLPLLIYPRQQTAQQCTSRPFGVSMLVSHRTSAMVDGYWRFRSFISKIGGLVLPCFAFPHDSNSPTTLHAKSEIGRCVRIFAAASWIYQPTSARVFAPPFGSACNYPAPLFASNSHMAHCIIMLHAAGPGGPL